MSRQRPKYLKRSKRSPVPSNHTFVACLPSFLRDAITGATLARGAPPRRYVRVNAQAALRAPCCARTLAAPAIPAGESRARAGSASTFEIYQALQALTRSKQPHLRCPPSFVYWRSDHGRNSGAGSAAATECARKRSRRSPGTGKRAQTSAESVRPAGKAVTSDSSRALQPLTRRSNPTFVACISIFRLPRLLMLEDCA